MDFRVLVRVGIGRPACQTWTAIRFIFKISRSIVYIYLFSGTNILTSDNGKTKTVRVFDSNILDA
jgi:hypothetical protein